jgi:hypothetical protein
MDKGFDVGGTIDIAAFPKKSGSPQRGAKPRRAKAKRRSDYMSVRMEPSASDSIGILAASEIVPISEIVKWAKVPAWINRNHP